MIGAIVQAGRHFFRTRFNRPSPLVLVTFSLAFVASVGFAEKASACNDFFAGPPGGPHAFRYSSNCIQTDRNRFRITYEICSAGEKPIGFKWEEINWVSGKDVLSPFQCLSYTRFATDTAILDPTTIRTTVGNERTPAFVAKPAGAGRDWRVAYLERNVPAVESNRHRPFVLRVSILEGSDQQPAQLRAVLNGSDVDFILVLPAQYANEDAIKKYIPEVNGADPQKYLVRPDEIRKFQVVDADPNVNAYIEERKIYTRVAFRSEKREYGQELTMRFDAPFSEFADGLDICLKTGRGLTTCLGG